MQLDELLCLEHKPATLYLDQLLQIPLIERYNFCESFHQLDQLYNRHHLHRHFDFIGKWQWGGFPILNSNFSSSHKLLSV